MAGHRCPFCKTFSKGEKGIRDYLTINNILFKEQVTFEDLLSDKNRKLRYDFGIYDKDAKLLFLLEFDGSHHYHDYGRPEKFKDIKRRDEIKNQYAKNKNITLKRIPYWANLTKVLDNIIKDNKGSTTIPDECRGVEVSTSKYETDENQKI